MKKIFYLLSILLFFSCSKPQQPTFERIENVKIVEITGENVRIEANMILHNPNDVSCTIKTTNLNIFADDKKVGKVDQKYETSMPANDDFSIPVTVDIPPEQIFEDGGILEGILNVLSSKKVNLHYLGNVKVSVMGVSFKIPVDFEEEVPIKIK